MKCGDEVRKEKVFRQHLEASHRSCKCADKAQQTGPEIADEMSGSVKIPLMQQRQKGFMQKIQCCCLLVAKPGKEGSDNPVMQAGLCRADLIGPPQAAV